MKRDQVNEKQVRARMNKQIPQEEKIRLADFVINNDGKQSLIRQVLNIHRQLVEIQKESKEHEI